LIKLDIGANKSIRKRESKKNSFGRKSQFGALKSVLYVNSLAETKITPKNEIRKLV
jgi:hypothetical protein